MGNNHNKNISSNNAHKQDHVSPEILGNHHRTGFELVALTENHVPTDKTHPIYYNPGYWDDKDFQDVDIYTRFKNVATTLGKANPNDSVKRDNLKDNPQPFNATKCFRKATESINVDIGKFGAITLLLCKSCLTIFEAKNENLNQSDCSLVGELKQSD